MADCICEHHRLPGILAALPRNLPFHPYHDDCQGHRRKYYNMHKRRRHNRAQINDYIDPETLICKNDGDQDTHVIADRQIHQHSGDQETFTLFFFIDGTNRQSLLAISIVSKWFHHCLNGYDKMVEKCDSNRVICFQNEPPHQRSASILSNTGFYELPFHHSSRSNLLYLLNASRVPSIIVVRNKTGRVVTPWGWEAIEREGVDGGVLDQWIVRNTLHAKKGLGEKRNIKYMNNTASSSDTFCSKVLEEWKKGRSGLPCWWHLLSCLF